MWGVTPSFPPGVQPGQARRLLSEERGERATGQAAETEAAERCHLPPSLSCARCPRPGPCRQGSPPPSQRSLAPLLAPSLATVTLPFPLEAVCDLASGIIRSLLPQRLPSSPLSQTEQRYFYKRIFYVLPDRVRDAGREGACWGVGCEGPSAKTLSGRRCCSPRGLPQQGRAPPPFLSTELPRGETETSPLPSPEALLLGSGTPQAVTL